MQSDVIDNDRPNFVPHFNQHDVATCSLRTAWINRLQRGVGPAGEPIQHHHFSENSTKQDSLRTKDVHALIQYRAVFCQLLLSNCS